LTDADIAALIHGADSDDDSFRPPKKQKQPITESSSFSSVRGTPASVVSNKLVKPVDWNWTLRYEKRVCTKQAVVVEQQTGLQFDKLLGLEGHLLEDIVRSVVLPYLYDTLVRIELFFGCFLLCAVVRVPNADNSHGVFSNNLHDGVELKNVYTYVRVVATTQVDDLKKLYPVGCYLVLLRKAKPGGCYIGVDKHHEVHNKLGYTIAVGAGKGAHHISQSYVMPDDGDSWDPTDPVPAAALYRKNTADEVVNYVHRHYRFFPKRQLPMQVYTDLQRLKWLPTV